MDKRKAIAEILLVIALAAGLPAGVQAQGGDDGLVTEWHFDEESGGFLGKLKVSSGQYFTTPVGTVMECLKKRGEEPDRCSPVKIAAETGVPLEVIGGLLGSG